MPFQGIGQLYQEISTGWAHSVVGVAACVSRYYQIGQVKLSKNKNNETSFLAHFTIISFFLQETSPSDR